VYCALAGTWLVLPTDWYHEVEKVQQRLNDDKTRMRDDEETVDGGGD